MSTYNNQVPARKRVQNLLSDSGWEHFGMGAVTQPLSMIHYDQWIHDHQHGDMKYLKDHQPLKTSLTHLSQKAKSLIAIGVDYIPHPSPVEPNFPIQQLKVARYASGNDYHHWFLQKLEDLCQKLKDLYPEEEFLCYSDSKPILERDFARQLGLGWFGKNSCLIHPKRGSFFLIGEIITSMDLGPSLADPIPDMCGTCTRCIDACPTEAINDNKTLDAKKCISYWTIESKTNPPISLQKNFSAWFFGCDICQQVCPWNEKRYGKETLNPQDILNENRIELIREIQWILESSNKSLMKSFTGTPLTRSGGHGLKRNALIVIQNKNLKELLPFLEQWSPNRPNLEELRLSTMDFLNSQ